MRTETARADDRAASPAPPPPRQSGRQGRPSDQRDRPPDRRSLSDRQFVCPTAVVFRPPARRPAVHVREATPADAGAIFEVHRASIEVLGREGYDEAQVAAWGEGGSPDDYELDDPGLQFVVAEREGRVVGFGCLAVEPGEHLDADVDAEVTAVYVHPSAARQGVGSALLADLERRARERGSRSLGLWASLNAVPFYESRGYDRVGERTHEFSGGVEGRVVEMRTEP